MLYKMPYDYSVKDLVKQLSADLVQRVKPDLAECLFGFNTKDAPVLKGRVQFGHAICTEQSIQPMPPFTEILGSPNASFYPYYLQQNVDGNGRLKGNYQRYNYEEHNKEAWPVIKGRKRYPIQRSYRQTPSDGNRRSNVATSFQPLPGRNKANGAAGTTFTTKIRFHNLLPVELGALLSAITFHQNPADVTFNNSEVFHSIGMGKPLGLGKTKLTIEPNNINLNGQEVSIDSLKKYLSVFEKRMNEETKNIAETWLMSKPCLLYTSPSPRDATLSRMPSSA